MADDRRIVAEVAGAVGLDEGEPGVRSVISALARLEPVSIRRISRASGLPVPIVASICGELRKRRVVAEERPAQLTARGRELFAGGGLAFGRSPVCPECSGRGIVVQPELASCVRDVARAARDAPKARFELDQCHCTVETKLRRVLAAHDADALVGRRILVLGDDDLTSLAISSVVRRFGSQTSIAGLTVLDVDTDLVAFVRARLAGAPFPVSCIRHDLRDALPARLHAGFDTVFTDPPYTEAGARLFLSRAASALVPGGSVFLSFGSKRPGASFAVQRLVTEMGLVVRSLLRDFSSYVGAGVLGGTSHLYHLTATRELRPLVNGRFEGPLYTAEVR